MLRKPLAICIPVMLAIALAATANTPPSAPTPSAAEIVEKNVAARGGLQAWRSVQTMSMTGKMSTIIRVTDRTPRSAISSAAMAAV